MSALDLTVLLDQLADAVAARVVERLKQQPPPPQVDDDLPDDDLPEACDTPTAAVYLGTTQQTLKARRLRGVGPPFFRVGRWVRYPRAALREFRRTNTGNSSADH